MIPVLLACTAAIGVYLVYSAIALGRVNLVADSARTKKAAQFEKVNDWLAQAGITREARARVAYLVFGLFAGTLFVGWSVFGGLIAPVALGLFVASFPVAAVKSRRKRTRAEAAEAWPRMIEEMRIACGSLGRAIPQALFETGRKGPLELRPAFADAEREWRLSTDFAKAVAVLKERLADSTADAVCETLLVAHALGGSDVDRRLAALAEDRLTDLHGRKDARSKQAGVRFARRFVLVVPAGMALAGMSIGDGRAAYATASGQIGVAVAIAFLAACWWWAGRLIALPEEQRVLRG